MADYNNDMSGVLFRNNKEGNEARPDYRGKIEINGVEYTLAAWIRESKKDGSKFMSLKATNKAEETGQNRRETPEDYMPDIPF